MRFLLADDLGAGKTITAVLLTKELLIRGELERCLIVAPGSLHHHRGAALAALAVGPDAVAAQQSHGQVARPLIRQGEAELDWRLLGLRLLEAGLGCRASMRRSFSTAAARGRAAEIRTRGSGPPR